MKQPKKKLHIPIVTAMNSPALFQPFFRGSSWDRWRVVLKAAFALPMSEAEREFFRSIAERDPPTSQVSELWICAGRRAGKDSIASMISAHTAALFNQHYRLRRGERALVACLACNREQAQIVLGYVRAYFTDIPTLQAMVTRQVANGFELSNGVDIAIATNSFRSIRGRSILCTILDEVAFWRDESSATPDEEVYRAIKPGMATLPGGMLIGISTPYRKAGLLYKKFSAHYGKDGDILVVRAPSTTLNPTLDQAVVDQAFADDPALAAAEWMAEFRSDIEGFVDTDVVQGCVGGHFELPPLAQYRYYAFVDPSGGSADSMTMAISHKEGERIVIDLVREVKPPFSPETTIDDFAIALKPYRISTVVGDRYAGEFPREQFRKRGIQYRCSEKPKSDLYRDLLPILNSGRIVLPKSDRLVNQLCGLERRTSRAGKDSIDHGPGTHDDLANVLAGAANLIVLADRAQNTGSGFGTYGYIVQDDDQVETSGTPDTADHSKAYKGFFHERFTELRAQWKGGYDEKLIGELRELRATTGDLDRHKTLNEFIGEIQRGG
jgi:hypothetical protein